MGIPQPQAPLRRLGQARQARADVECALRGYEKEDYEGMDEPVSDFQRGKDHRLDSRTLSISTQHKLIIKLGLI
jgi:hypothetical protein